ncbi:acetate--CoA ligase family protein [Pseudomonas sp. JQ170]|uniref:acetate--CoA ligase family protein n=1 Tax=unclassified Pseudomonas TaxID=196821 RepID=UPI00264D0C69|nr:MULTISPECIES: acetate--CoA ligase family protein [unclassified Pseudomonas]MDN7140046.1 acetate--CoA ligase family protein [Pseudomonas sp. JQ170]WRO78597.1 acetate--CoA ligase family protein [Pseudomonas sp. 170C]
MSTFDLFFTPRSVAVIGASQDLASISGQPIAHLKAKGFAGQVLPVNPRYDEVAGYRCYPDVASLPVTPDVAVIAVGAKRVPDALQALGSKGCRFAVILSSGFAEAGEQGAEAQRALTAIARSYGMQVIGPNCQGYMNISAGIHVGFGAPYGLTYPKGHLSLTSQSGAFGNSIVMLASQEGIGFRHYVSTGNESVTTSLDFMDAMIDDPETRVIAGYVEGFQDARRLLGIGRRALIAGKPMLIWKVGTSEAGARAAASHTANLGGSMALYRAAFRQSGIIEVNDVGDLADCAKALLPGRLPKGKRLAVVTISGGAGIAMADGAAHGGLVLPELAPATVTALKEVLPSFAAVANPLDVTASLLTDASLLRVTLEQLADDPNVDMIGLALAAASGALATELANEIVRIRDERGIPVLVAWNADPATVQAAYDILDAAGIPRYQSPVRCARGASALWAFAEARGRVAQVMDESPLQLTAAPMRALLGARRSDLTEFEAKKVVAAYGIGVTQEALASNADEASRIAQAMQRPVVMKIQSADIPHKTEAGGVRVGVQGSAQVRAAFAEILGNARSYAPEARIDGVLVQEMVSGGTELILGINNDPLFGPAVMVGFGGIFAEVMKDVSFRLAPITRSEAHAMLRELRSFPILDGARGRPKADVEAVVDTLMRVSAMAVDLAGVLQEFDINPLFVLKQGEGVRAGDALAKPLLPAGEASAHHQPSEDALAHP